MRVACKTQSSFSIPWLLLFLSQHGIDRIYMEVKLLLGVVWSMDHSSPLSLPFGPSHVFTLKVNQGQRVRQSSCGALTSKDPQATGDEHVLCSYHVEPVNTDPASSSGLETEWGLCPFIPIFHRRYGYFWAGLSAHCTDREGMLLCRQRGALTEVPPLNFVH